jgi:hypothetical protein
LVAYRYIGGSKTTLKNIRKGLPKHEVGNIDVAYDYLKKKGFFLYEIRNREPYFSLYPKCVRYASDLIKYNRCPLCYYYLEDLEYCRECRKDLSKIREHIKD